MKRLHPRSYLLLELLLALTLVTLCILPFVNIPSQIMREEILMMQRIDLQRISDLSFGLVQEHLYTNQIPWEIVCSPQDQKAIVLKNIISLPSLEGGIHRFERTCQLYSIGKKGGAQTEHRLVTVLVSLKKIGSHSLFSGRKRKKTVKFLYQISVSKSPAKPIQVPIAPPPATGAPS